MLSVCAWICNLIAEGSTNGSLVGPFINLGAVGVCLVAIAIWYTKKDARYEARMDDQIKREQDYRKEIADLHNQYRKEAIDLAERYRLALEKFNQTLDSVIRMMTTAKRGKSGGGEL